MKQHFCSAENSLIEYEKECNWCGEKEWVGLTDEEMLECDMDGDYMVDREIAKLNVQAKLKEKNT